MPVKPSTAMDIKEEAKEPARKSKMEIMMDSLTSRNYVKKQDSINMTEAPPREMTSAFTVAPKSSQAAVRPRVLDS